MADTTTLKDFFSEKFDSIPESGVFGPFPDTEEIESSNRKSLDMNLFKMEGNEQELATMACPHGWVKVDGYCVRILGNPQQDTIEA